MHDQGPVREKRYQVFLSSTYKDLEVERSTVTQEVLKTSRFIPAGMELFSASSLPPWDLITRVLDVTDYFVLVLGSRYGSAPQGSDLSYTEMEHDYAVDHGIPVLAFLASSERRHRTEDAEESATKRRALARFRARVEQGPTVAYWSTPQELAQEVTQALWKESYNVPRPGWVRDVARPAAAQDVTSQQEPGTAAQDPQEVEHLTRRVLEQEAARHHLRDAAGLVLIAEPLETTTDIAVDLSDPVVLRALIADTALPEEVAQALQPWAQDLGRRDPATADVRCAHPDASALCSRPAAPSATRASADRSPEHHFCQVGVTDDGGVRFYAEPVGYRAGLTGGPYPGLELGTVVVLTRRFTALVAAVAQGTGYHGAWALGAQTVKASNLPALTDGQPTTDRLYGEYTHCRPVTSEELTKAPGATSGALLRRLLRQFPTAPDYSPAFTDLASST